MWEIQVRGCQLWAWVDVKAQRRFSSVIPGVHMGVLCYVRRVVEDDEAVSLDLPVDCRRRDD